VEYLCHFCEFTFHVLLDECAELFGCLAETGSIGTGQAMFFLQTDQNNILLLILNFSG